MSRTCRICGGDRFKEVIDFGDTPLVNSLIEKEDLDKEEDTFPLVVEQCQDCFLVQIVNIVEGQKIYRDQDYLYFSGDMPNLSAYFKEYAQDLKDKYLDSGDFIVEIGSNDGTMLKHFPEYRVLGVDPSTNVVIKALSSEIPTISDFFSKNVGKNIVRYFGRAKVIYGNNCIAHTSNLHEIMEGVKATLTKDGVFVVECNYWGAMVENKNYSLIYHDHYSYFTIQDWGYLAEKYDMKVIDAEVTPAQGGSLRVFISNHEGRKMTERCSELIKKEADSNLGSHETAQKYNKEVKEQAEKLGTLIKQIRSEGKIIAGYGAAAKGFSILHLAKITEKEIDYFVDDSPAKQGKYTPVTHIPVISRAEVKELPDFFFITAPNYKDVIMEKEAEFAKKGGKFILEDCSII